MSSSPAILWTPSQWRAITATNTSLLVSAAAGSGKTAVLSERCAYLVCDAPNPIDVDELLVVTFTESAAAEMKARIRAALTRRLAANPTPRLRKQLALLERAPIGTLHSFCARLLRQHFQAAQIDPNFTILDPAEAALLQLETARQMFADRYETDETGAFQAMIDDYADGDDERVVRRVIRAAEALRSVPRRAEWCATAIRRLQSAAPDSELGGELNAYFGQGLADLHQRCIEAADTIAPLGFPPYVAQLQEFAAILSHWQNVLATHGPDDLVSEVTNLEWPPLPRTSTTAPNRDLAKALIDGVRAELKAGPMIKALRFTTAQWQAGLDRTRPVVELFVNLVQQLDERFSKAKRELEALDFSDLEQLSLHVLQTNGQMTGVAHSYQRQFKQVLVDEFQDINEMQNEILGMVSRPDNLFTVGDVKQSIYRFRLAEPAWFLERRAKLLPAQVIDLQENFRSRSEVLEVINSIFARLMTRQAADIEYDESQHLRPAAPYPPDAGQMLPHVALHLLPAAPGETEASEEEPEQDRTEREAAFVAREIRKLMGMDGGQRADVHDRGVSRPIHFGDIVVLLRSMQYKSEQFAETLRAAGVPVVSGRGVGFFEAMEIRDLMALLSILDNQQQDIPLAAILRSPIARMTNVEESLAEVRLAYPPPTEFWDAVGRYAGEKEDALAGKLSEILGEITQWREMAQRRPLAEVIWTIYEQTGYLAFCAGLANGQQRVANLLELHERARQFGTFQRQGLARFLRFMESLKEEAALGQASMASETDDVVRIMSVHASKGLEFPVVFIADLGKAFNLQDCRGTMLLDRAAGVGFVVADDELQVRYPSLASTLVQRRLQQQALAEELRVLYVAMTRAKERLVLIGTCGEGKIAEWRAMWGGHVGPLPAWAVLGARNVLDWIGPAVAAAEADDGSRAEITWHGEQTSEDGTERRRTQLSALQTAMGELQTLDVEVQDSSAEEIIRSLEFEYPHRESVTRAALVAKSRDREGRVILEMLDFSNASTEADVRAQIAEMIERGTISEHAAADADINGIIWFANSKIGKLLRDNPANAWWGMTVYMPGDVGEGLDRAMVRGELDLVVETTDGAVLIDFDGEGPRISDADAARAIGRGSVKMWHVRIGERQIREMARR